jgi:hypothetical protein
LRESNCAQARTYTQGIPDFECSVEPELKESNFVAERKCEKALQSFTAHYSAELLSASIVEQKINDLLAVSNCSLSLTRRSLWLSRFALMSFHSGPKKLHKQLEEITSLEGYL